MRLTSRNPTATPAAGRRVWLARAAAARVLAANCGLAATSALVVAAGGGCAGDGPAVSLKSDDVAGRIPAMKRAAGRHDPKAFPDLVASLSSEDAAERMFAIRALREITGQTFGYNYYEGDAARAPAVQRWKAWLSPTPAAAATQQGGTATRGAAAGAP